MKYIVGLFVFAFVLWGAQPWSKDYTNWTKNDVQWVLQDSPWAQASSASFDNFAVDPDNRSGPVGPQGAAASGLAGAKQKWDGGVGKITNGMPTFQVTIRWDSALPVRQALARERNTNVDSVGDNYLITVIGLWPKARVKPADDSGEEDPLPPRDPSDMGHMREELMANAKLLRKGKPSLLPEDVKLDPSTGAIQFVFPKKNPISIEEKEVTFATPFGPMRISKKFRLKDMTYKGKLEL